MKYLVKYCIILIFILGISQNFSFSQNQHKIDSLENLLKKQNQDTSKMKVIKMLCDELRSDPIKQLNYAEQGLSISKKNNKRDGELTFLAYIGTAYYQRGSYDTSLSYYNQSLDVSEQLNKERPGDKHILSSMALTINNTGNIYYAKGNFPGALQCYLKALPIHEKLGNKDGAGLSYLSISAVYFSLKKQEKSLEFAKKALFLFDETGTTYYRSYVLNNIGGLYLEMADLNLKDTAKVQELYGNAIEYFNKALETQKIIQDRQIISSIQSNIGLIYFRKAGLSHLQKQKNEGYKMALSYYFKALVTQIEISDPKSICISKNNIGRVYDHLGKFDSAVKYFNEGLLLARSTNAPESARESLSELSSTYYKNKNFELAYQYYKKYSDLKDSIFNGESQKQINEMQTLYETDKKNAEIKLLGKDNEKQMAIAEEEKNKKVIILTSGIVIIALLGIFAFFMVNRFLITRKQNRVIELQKLEVENQRDLIGHQKKLVDEHQKEILDSIHYAKRIQTTLLAHQDFVNKFLPENFILFKPKDIVSGDFYWAAEHNNKFYLATCDSTGHGVPGAFMSLLNMGFLSEAIKEKDILKPHEVFEYVRKRLIEGVSKDGQKDGMDGILICVDNDNITYSAANNCPVIVSNGKIIELQADKMPVGKGELENLFTANEIQAQKGDMIYLFTDGFPDQFGGPKGKKFKYKPFYEMLISISELSLIEQKEKLNFTFENWKADLEQVDDVLVIGIRI